MVKKPWVAARALSSSTAKGRLSANNCIGTASSGSLKTESARVPAARNQTVATSVESANGVDRPRTMDPRTTAASPRAMYAATKRVMAARIPRPQTRTRMARNAKATVYWPTASPPRKRARRMTIRTLLMLLTIEPASAQLLSWARLGLMGALTGRATRSVS